MISGGVSVHDEGVNNRKVPDVMENEKTGIDSKREKAWAAE